MRSTLSAVRRFAALAPHEGRCGCGEVLPRPAPRPRSRGPEESWHGVREPVDRRRDRGVAARHRAVPGARPPPASLFVDAFDVEQVASLAPGAVLQFSVFASPGASATVLIEGVRRLVELREVQPGVYEGTLRHRGRRSPPCRHHGGGDRLARRRGGPRHARGIAAPRRPRRRAAGRGARTTGRAGACAAPRAAPRVRAAGASPRRRQRQNAWSPCAATAPWSSRSARSRCRPARPTPVRSPAASSARCSASRSARRTSAT